MKKSIAFLVCLVLMLSIIQPMNALAAAGQLEGAGTEAEPWLISEAEDFVLMSNLIGSDASYADDYYQMTNDIDFTGVTMTSIGKSNHFSGVFDGQLYKVKNLTMNDTSDNTGLFSFVEGGTIKNLGIVSSTITGAKKVGALVGRSMNAVFMNCYSKATVSGTYDIGGIVGMLNSSQMYNCYSMATTRSTKESGGGLAGSLNTSLNRSNPVKLDNVYSVATVNGTTYYGIIAGWNENMQPEKNPVYTTNAYYYGSTGAFGNYGHNTTGYAETMESGVTSLEEARLTDGTLLSKLNEGLADGYQEWIVGDNGYPEFKKLEVEFSGAGTEEAPYIIDSVEDLLEMANAVSDSAVLAGAHYRMTENIDLEGVQFNGIPSTTGFSGTFDGTGHVLKNVDIDNGGADYTGIFHYTNGATIKNLGVESGRIEGGSYVGGIAGKASNTTIINCFNAATVNGYKDVGGIIGISNDSSILNSFNKGLIRVSHKSIGGLMGSSERTTTKNSYNIGKVYVGTYTGKVIGYSYEDVFENVYYNKEEAIRNQPVGNFKEFDGIIAKTKTELTEAAFVDVLNANLEEGFMTWIYGEDKIARLADFEETAKLDIFMASIEEVLIKDNKVQSIVSEDGAYKTVVYGSDHKSVIDLEGNVYQPLTTQKVLLILNIVDTATGEVVKQLDRNIEVTVEGKYVDVGVNEVPNVVPGLREWYGLEGNFEVTENTRIAAADEEMAEMAVRIQQYMEDMLGLTLEVVSEAGNAGDIILKYAPERIAELQEEGYAIEITDRIVIESSTETAMLYGAISIMQILYQDEDHVNIPKGYVRDYPQYEMRGGMMDVARKYFSIDYVEEIGKYMSWFKMNTLSLHINDNGGEYTASFVVESKNYPALNSYNGEYVWSQDDYRQMQKNLKEFGVKVITEIDTPGHAKAFAKVNSTIVSGASFNLGSYYDESLALVEDVFDEFLDGDDPVFQNAVVHIGTDESSNTKENMRRYISDLSQYMLAKDNVEKVVFWGNLSLYYGQTEIDPENVIAQIWDSADFRADEALELGFELINSTSNMMYLVPNKGTAFGPGTYFQGYIDMAKFYDTWKGGSDFDTNNLVNPESKTNGFYYAEHDILKGNPNVLGTLFCDWNDTGIGYDYDLLELMMAYIAGVSEKCWYGDTDRFESGEEFVEAFNQVGDYAAYANPRYRVDSDSNAIASYSFEKMTDGVVADSVNGYDAAVANGKIAEVDENHKTTLALDGTTSVALPFKGVGYPYTASFEIYLNGTQSQDAILFTCDDCTIYLDYEDNGVCFQSGKYTYSFGVDIPTDQWVEVMLTSQSPSFVHASTNMTTLMINGVEYTPSNITNSRSQSRSTVLGTEEMFTGITGYVDDFSISNKYSYAPILDTYEYEGEGTKESPYLIQTAEDLRLFSLFVNAGMYTDAYFKLTADIDMTDVRYKSAAEFGGTLDGDGHKIMNLTISETSTTNVGLIGFLNGGVVRNLGIDQSTIAGGNRVGALAGKTMDAVIINCYSKASVSGTNDIGGLVGMLNSTQMYNCYSAATVTGTQSVAGVAGSINSSLNLDNLASMDNVYSIATVTGTKYTGMIAGWDEGSSDDTPVDMTNVYYYGTLSASGNYADREATLLTEAEVTDGTLLNALNANLVDGYENWAEDVEKYPCFRYQLNSSELEAVIKEASEIETTDYTAESAETLANAIQSANEALTSDSQYVMNQAEQNLKDAVAGLTYKGADYTEVDEALAKVPEDLSVYTEETANAVTNAVNAVVRDKNITQQAEVDAMAKAINDAVAALEEIATEEVCEIFTDISHGAWYEASVQYVYDNGIMSGNDGLFKPTGNITRAQVVTTLYNLEGRPEVSDYSAVDELVDVEAGKWYTDAVCWAYSVGVANGNASTKMFNMNNPVTRQQLATFFYNYAEYKELDITTREDISGMVGADQVASYALDTMQWAVGTGLISGSATTGSDGTTVYDLKPTGTATRAQMASILERFCENNHL